MNPSQKLLGLIALLGTSASSLLAQSTWIGNAGNWSSDANPGWNGTGVPNAVGATANISSGTGSITIDGTYTLGTLTSAATRGLSNTSGTLIFSASSGNALFDFTNGLVGGTGTIGGFNTYASILQLNSPTEFRGLVSTSSAAPIFSGRITGAGQMLITNVATTPAGGGVRFDLRNSTSDFTGGINIGLGTTLRLNASGAAGSGTITLADTASGGNSIDFRTDVSTTAKTYANNIHLGTRTVGFSSSILNLQGATTDVTLTGVLSGAMNTGRLSLSGGTLTLGGTAGANTWTGQLRSDTHGTLIADKVGALSTNGFDMRSQLAGSTTTLLVGVSDTITGQISVNGNNSGAGFAYVARLGLKDGNNGTVTFTNANKINLNNAFGVGGTDLAPGPVSLQLHSGNGNGTLNVSTEIGRNTNARNIEITGTGVVNLNRDGGNTYGGATLITGGTLLANNTTGSATGGTGLVTVGALGALGGNGIISGSVTFNAGAKFVFSVDQTLDINGATVTWGDFGIDDLAGLTGSTDVGTYTLIGGTTVISQDNLSNIGESNAAPLLGGKQAYFDLTTGDLRVVVANAIPEPSAFAALAGLAVLGCAALRRRR